MWRFSVVLKPMVPVERHPNRSAGSIRDAQLHVKQFVLTMLAFRSV